MKIKFININPWSKLGKEIVTIKKDQNLSEFPVTLK